MHSTKLFCIYCNSQSCIRRGFRGAVQKLYCKCCHCWQQTAYCNHRYGDGDEDRVREYHNEGLGTSSIGRLLKIPKTSVQLLLERKAKKLSFKTPQEKGQSYLLDELQTFVKRNTEQDRYYVISVMNKKTGAIIESITGKRRQETIQPMIDRLMDLEPKRIYTDGWNGYKGMLTEEVEHVVFAHLINRLERFHLSMRQGIKRLTRQTLSFSKSERMVNVSVKLFCC
ncbi:MAG: transposase, IS1 family [Bacteroidetes bacterium]|nr:MAG: transposase, IS1 family [Bacteroidota bacterium]